MKHQLLRILRKTLLGAWPAALLALLPLLALAQSSTLVISQVYPAGGNLGASYNSDFVEIFNKSPAAITLSGYSLTYNGGPPLALAAAASIPAGGYYLVQLAPSPSGTGAALQPDQTSPSNINLSAAGGRVELLKSTSATPVDKVAYGTGTSYEGSGPAAISSSTTQAAFRSLGGCTDTDDNKNDFTTGPAAPRNSTLVPSPCAGPAPAISSFSPSSGPAGTRVTVQGSGFAGNASVAFGGVAATAVTVTSTTALTATVPSGAASGPITVTTAGGSASSTDNFAVIVPVITVSPATLTGLAASQGNPSAPQTYQLSGSSLDGASLTITASTASLEVSLDGTAYARSTSLPLKGATLGATTVYVRIAGGVAQGSANGSISNANGPTTTTVTVQGAVLTPTAAKRWTGGAGTNSWFDAGNWAGGTLPTSTDDVVLDHRTVTGKYTVVLGNSASPAPVSVASLRLRPGSSGDSILFVIPATNTVSSASGSGPALLLTRSSAGDTALVVGNRAFFTNASGAAGGVVLDAAGNTNPTVFLLNGGSFRHQTARGVTDIVENLSAATGTEAGNFYYRPTGTSSFTTPLAGRTYGNLLLQFLRNGNFTSINYGASGGSPLTVNGSLTIESGATLSYNVLANLILRGNLVNNGIFRYAPNYATPAPSPLPTYRLVLQGTTPQVLAGNALVDPSASTAAQSSYLAATIQLEINNPAGATLQAPVTLSNALALTSGLLTTDATNILTMTLAGTGAVLGGSDASFVNGPVRRPVGTTTSATAHVFPIGKGAAYRPLTLTVASQTGTTNYRAEQFEGNPVRTLGSPDLNGQLTRVSSVRYFSLTPFNSDAVPVLAQPTGFTGTVALTYGSDDGVTDPRTLVVAKRADVTQPWYDFGRGNASGTASGGLVTSGTIATFSDLALGSTDAATTTNPLPVQLVSFAATRLAGGAVALTWTTASELNSARFEVERSLDGATFAPVATLGAPGTSTQARTYGARDATAPAGALYYRLRLVDQDGTSAYSPTITVATGPAAELVLSPNPTHDQLYFSVEAAGAYTVRSLLGQEVLRGPAANGLNQLPVGQLPAGVYLLELPTSAGRVVRRFAKE